MNPHLRRSLASGPLTHQEMLRRVYLASRADRDAELADAWRRSQAFHTRAPGTVVREELRQAIADTLYDLRDLIGVMVRLHVTPTMAERAAFEDTLERLPTMSDLCPERPSS
jgi:hypothetical protein